MSRRASVLVTLQSVRTHDVSDLFLRSCLTTDDVSVFQEGRRVHAGYYADSPSTSSRAATVRPDVIHQFLVEGATVRLERVERYIPSLWELCTSLAEDFRGRSWANIYLASDRACGLGPHSDAHDVFALQISGRKQWEVFEQAVDGPVLGLITDVERIRDASRLFVQTLSAGDVLYIPAGFVHSANEVKGVSVHATIGVRPITNLEVIESVFRHRAKSEPRLRLPALQPGLPHLDARVFAELIRHIADEIEHDGLNWAEHCEQFQRSPRASFLKIELTLSDIDARAIVAVRDSMVRWTKTKDGRTSITDGTIEVLASSVDERLLGVLLDGRPHCLGELNTDLSIEALLDLVRGLLREHLLVMVAPTDAAVWLR